MPAGRCIIREQAVIRGDLARVRNKTLLSFLEKAALTGPLFCLLV